MKISYLTTRIFGIDYILSQRVGTGSTDVTLSSSSDKSNTQTNTNTESTGENQSSSAESGIKIQSNDEVKFWQNLDEELRTVLNRPGDKYEANIPIINKNAGLITVTATYEQLNRFQEYLKRLQDKVQLQVLIDVQLLSVTMNEGRTTGVDWQQLYALQDIELSINTVQSRNVNTFNDKVIDTQLYGNNKSNSQLINIKAGGSLKEVIKFLKTQGDVNSISNPKVLTLNNQPALITVGTEFFYKIKQSTNQQGTGGGVAATTQQDEVKSVFAGVLLDITPEISNDKTITLKINPSLSETTYDMSLQTSVNRDMPPDLNRRQLSSVVTIKDGNRVILGGLINTKNTYKSNKIPILGDIPLLSYLFEREEILKHVEELIIIIEPHIISKDKNEVSLSDLGYASISDELLGKKIEDDLDNSINIIEDIEDNENITQETDNKEIIEYVDDENTLQETDNTEITEYANDENTIEVNEEVFPEIENTTQVITEVNDNAN